MATVSRITTQNNNQAMAWALMATGMFAIAAVMAKYGVVALGMHVLQILFVRQMIVLLSSLPLIARDFPNSLKTQHPVIHAVRLGGAFLSLSCGIWAVAELPLTTATTLGFAQVFFVATLAMVFLGERVGPHRLGAIFAGFLGVLIVMRPGSEGLFTTTAFIPLAGALGAGFAVISVRRLSQTESTATLLAYQSVFVGLLSGVPMLWLWQPPSLAGWCLLIAMGGIATLGQWIGVKALRMGEASVIGNVEYVKLIWAAGFGYVLFGEVPDAYTLVGAAVIVGAALYMLRREGMRGQA